MSAIFVKLPGRDRQVIYVNSDQVRMFKSNDDGQTTVIYFDDVHSVVVYATPDGLHEAMKMVGPSS